MKLPFGFHLIRGPIVPEVVKETQVIKEKVFVIDPASLGAVYRISVSGGEFDWEQSCKVPEVFAYYSDCVKANKAHPGRMGQSVQVIRSGEDIFLAPYGVLTKIEMAE